MSMSSDKSQASAPLTHYHSLFNNLLTWKNPRDSAIAYASIVSVIAAARYLDVIRYAFKMSWIVLGTTVAAEVAGKAVFNKGLATQFRPRTYHQISRDTIDKVASDLHEFANFLVIEAQRILYVENVSASATAFVAAFISYFLTKVVPYWALAVLATTLAFFVPLIYTTNQEAIDHYLKQAADVIDAQTAELRGMVSKHTAHATSLTKQYMGDYTAKAQSLLRTHTGAGAEVAEAPKPAYKEADFPEAPKGDVVSDKDASEIIDSAKAEQEPLLA